MIEPVLEWPQFIIESYLGSWWDLHPGLYGLYYSEYDKSGRDMIAALRNDHPVLFEKIWDDLATKEIEEWYPPRPRFT